MKNTLSFVIPFAIISGAMAITSTKKVQSRSKEFVTYESSLYDIFGVLYFNFIICSDSIGSKSVGFFYFRISNNVWYNETQKV